LSSSSAEFAQNNIYVAQSAFSTRKE